MSLSLSTEHRTVSRRQRVFARVTNMKNTSVLVLGRPQESQLRLLAEAPDCVVCVGDSVKDFEAAAPEADVMLCANQDSELIQQVWRMIPNLRWVHTISAGVDHVLFPALVESSLPLTNSRGVYSSSLGEFCMAAVLFFAKDLARMMRSQAKGVWDPFSVLEINRQTLGIVGYGDIGHTVAQKAKAFDTTVLAVRRRVQLSDGDPWVDELFPPSEMDKLLARSDYVVLSLPLTAKTRHSFGEQELRAMKTSAVLINVGRGAIVDEPVLIEALRQRWIRGAALDVFENEPLPEGHPFYSLPNVLLSPHCADQTKDWLDESVQFFIENLGRYQRGDNLHNIVDKNLGY